MTETINKLTKIVIISIAAFLISCSDQKYYCSGLLKKAEKPNIRAYLRETVDNRVINQKLDVGGKLFIGGGMKPGAYRLIERIDWSTLGFAKDSQIRIVAQRGKLGRDYLSKPEAVFFGERSGVGFLVKTKYFIDWSRLELKIEVEYDRVAVLCQGRTLIGIEF